MVVDYPLSGEIVFLFSFGTNEVGFYIHHMVETFQQTNKKNRLIHRYLFF